MVYTCSGSTRKSWAFSFAVEESGSQLLTRLLFYPGDFEGGELIFPNEDESVKMVIQPSLFRVPYLLEFSLDWYYEELPVTRGRRYVLKEAGMTVCPMIRDP
jgi:hypothetical protein